MPRTVDHHERRERIAAALVRVAGARGLEAVSLRRVAAEAGVTSGMVQHYFPSKDAMLRFAMRSAGARYEARMNAAILALGAGPSAHQLVDAILTTLLPLDDTQMADARVALAFQSYAATDDVAAEELGAGQAQLRAYLAELLQGEPLSETTRVADERVKTATALLAMAEGLAVQVLSAGLPADAATSALRQQVDQAFECALDDVSSER